MKHKDTGKSMNNALYKLGMLKGAIANEKIKSIALAVIELPLSDGISQPVSQAIPI